MLWKKQARDAKRGEERLRALSPQPGDGSAKKEKKRKSLRDSNLSSPPSAPPAVEPAPPQPAVVVAKAAPPAPQKQTKKKVVDFDYGYSTEEHQPYRPVDVFSDDDDDDEEAILRKRTKMSSIAELYES